MGKSSIGWTDLTFNGWIGCEHHGKGCLHCYAEAQNRFYKWNGGQWGKGAPRKVTSPANWMLPLKWNREAEAAGVRRKVFGFSLADWADADGPEGALPWLWALWRATPWLDWQMLTKRAERIKDCLPPDWGEGYPNVWLGFSVACQEDAERGIPELIRVPAVVHFISCEPLVEAVDLDMGRCDIHNRDHVQADDRGEFCNECAADGGTGELSFWHWLDPLNGGISWVIVGGESGGDARPFHLQWARQIVKQCQDTHTPVFVKQLGQRPQGDYYDEGNGDPEHFAARGHDWTADDQEDGHQPPPGALVTLRLGKKQSEKLEEMPPDLRIREFPEVACA